MVESDGLKLLVHVERLEGYAEEARCIAGKEGLVLDHVRRIAVVKKEALDLNLNAAVGKNFADRRSENCKMVATPQDTLSTCSVAFTTLGTLILYMRVGAINLSHAKSLGT